MNKRKIKKILFCGIYLIAIIIMSLTIGCGENSAGWHVVWASEETPKEVTEFHISNSNDIIINSIGMKLIWIPPCEFMMGCRQQQKLKDREIEDDEFPQHNVRISKGFYMGQMEVTQAQYQAVMGVNPSYFKGDKLPVDEVRWYDANDFCKKLSQMEGKAYRLPTEAEWEYACRAGTNTPFSFGETISTDQANYNGDYIYEDGQKGINRQKTTEVGSFVPNAFGLYDMHGNVWEWCRDWYGENYYLNSPSLDPQGPSFGQYHVRRGGSWYFDAVICRSASRLGTDDKHFYGGFRVVLWSAPQNLANF